MGLHARSLQLMDIGEPEAKVAFVDRWRGRPLVFTTVTTCMEVIKQAVDEVRRDWGASRAGLWVWVLPEVTSYNCRTRAAEFMSAISAGGPRSSLDLLRCRLGRCCVRSSAPERCVPVSCLPEPLVEAGQCQLGAASQKGAHAAPLKVKGPRALGL